MNKISKNISNNLEIKSVSVKHLKQYDDLLRYVFQVHNALLEKSGYDEGELTQAKRPILRRSEVIGWFDKDKLISSLSIYPSKVNIHNKIYSMGGLTGVGTYPEYANQGLIKKLVGEALKIMKENKQSISYLYPFSIPFYRKKGWEIISDRMFFTINDTQLPKIPEKEITGQVKREKVNHPDVYKIYNIFSHNTHGSLIRNKWDWEEYWRWEDETERTAAIYYDNDNNPAGYILYWIKEDIFNIREMIYLNQSARKALWSFISAHFSMVTKVEGYTYKNEPIAFQLDDSSVKETIEPYYMARIIDVEEFLKLFPFKYNKKAFYFNVFDEQAKWNNGKFSVSWNKQKEKVISKRSKGLRIDIDIRTLTSLLMNYKKPRYFQNIERLQADNEALDLLENVIPQNQPYFSDYF